MTVHAAVVILPPVDEQARVLHAKEVLGNRHFKRSPAAKAKNSKYINLRIYHLLTQNLPAKYKKEARTIAKTLIQVSEKNNMDPIFVLAVMQTESSFNPKAEGTSGEIGLMQLMPSTAEWIAKINNIKYKGKKDLYNPLTNIKIGVSYLALLRDDFENNSSHYISAYNVGPGKLRKMVKDERPPAIYKIKVYENYVRLYDNLVNVVI